MIKLGNLKLKNRIFLAPMLEYNDIAFRMLCKKAGAGLVWTGMINPLSQQKLELEDKPAIQLFSNSDEEISRFIKKYEKKASLWDFNLGCPAKTAEKHGFGYCLRDLKMIEKILKTMRQSTKKPVTIKLRKREDILKIMEIAEKYCNAVCIHARTKKQGYSGSSDIKFALDIKKKTKLPVIYSGDVNETNAKDLLKHFDYVMIGRAAVGNPRIFAKLTGKKVRGDFFDYLKLAKKYKIKFEKIKIQAMNFTKGKDNASKMRKRIADSRSIEDIRRVYEN